jgi:membrane protein involved in colicin uptake
MANKLYRFKQQVKIGQKTYALGVHPVIDEHQETDWFKHLVKHKLVSEAGGPQPAPQTQSHLAHQKNVAAKIKADAEAKAKADAEAKAKADAEDAPPSEDQAPVEEQESEVAPEESKDESGPSHKHGKKNKR